MCCPLNCCRHNNDWSEKSKKIKEAKDNKRMSATKEKRCP